VIQGSVEREVILIRDLMSDEEWDCFAPFVIVRSQHRGRRPHNFRLVSSSSLDNINNNHQNLKEFLYVFSSF